MRPIFFILCKLFLKNKASDFKLLSLYYLCFLICKNTAFLRYFIELSYNGTNYHGWQKQPNAISVQEVLEKALSTILGETSYKGQPVKPHMHMEGLQRVSFERWLELFFETVDTNLPLYL